MSNAFFTALGYHFLQKHAGRIPWASVLHGLREKEILPKVIPRIPFIEPDIVPIGPAIPEELVEEALEAKEEEPTSEARPKAKSRGGEPSESD